MCDEDSGLPDKAAVRTIRSEAAPVMLYCTYVSTGITTYSHLRYFQAVSPTSSLARSSPPLTNSNLC